MPSAYLASYLVSLGITEQYLVRRNLVCYEEAAELVVADVNAEGRQFWLVPAAADGWRALKAAAAEEDVVIQLESAFRSVERQAELIRAKLAADQTIEQALCLVAPPGYSEHHTGRAVDIGTPGSAALEEEFETTTAFAWLQKNAREYGFHMSYPRGNPLGYAYEPWHWCHRGV